VADDRDRDEDGRARNARPRDGLGRPLPYGTPGVERQPEGVERTPDETVREAQRLLDDGMPFHAHEVFEDAWKTGPADEHDLWKGLAQLAVGLTHAARGNAVGSATLLRRGAHYIEAFTDSPHGIDVTGLVGWARRLADEVESGSANTDLAASAPRLRAG
jgi:predicted metal-dependent hydrolase